MKIYCCFTPAHRVFFDRYFAPSLPSTLDLRATELNLAGRGDFLSPEFLKCIRLKLDTVIGSIERHRGELIVWSDIDIQFFGDPVSELEALATHCPADLFFQREAHGSSHVNTGFIIIRCTENARAFFTRVRTLLEAQPAQNEQWAVNELLPSTDRGSWEYLPWSFYARTHGWPPPAQLVLYHANDTAGADGIGQKIHQFEEVAWVRRWGRPALLYSCLKRIPGKVYRTIARLGFK